MQSVLVYDGKSFDSRLVDSGSALRWGCWARDGRQALVVGNRGTAFLLGDGRKPKRIDTSTTENLRCCEFSPDGTFAIILGNRGMLLKFYCRDRTLKALDTGVTANLRRVAWGSDGVALAVGNEGAAYLVDGSHIVRVEGAENNLRAVSWRPTRGTALVTGNCFRPSMAGLLPSPNIYRYEGIRGTEVLLEPLGMTEGRADLTSASWRPDGSVCSMVGVDSVWRTPTLVTYDGERVLSHPWMEEGRVPEGGVYPTAIAWHPGGGYALIGTGGFSGEDGGGTVFSYDWVTGKSTPLLKLDRLWVSCISWNDRGQALLLVSRTKAFSV